MSSSGPVQRKNAAAPSTPSTTSASATPKPRKGHTGPSKVPISLQYLVLYNILSLVAWYSVAIRVLVVIGVTGENALLLTKGQKAGAGAKSPPKRRSLNRDRPAKSTGSETLFDATSNTLVWVQTLAVLEIVHSLIGIVGAGVLTTTMQVASRLMLCWGIIVPFGEALFKENAAQKFVNSTGLAALLDRVGLDAALSKMEPVHRNQYAYAGMLAAWAITECIRYMFFIFFLGGEKDLRKVPPGLRWLRYNSFFVLYPLGISCECWLIYHSIPYAAQIDERLRWVLTAILGIYVPGSYILYTHMIKQRARIMQSKRPKTRNE